MKNKKLLSFLFLLGLGYFLISFHLGVQNLRAEEKEEVIILGGHLDHLGRCYEIMQDLVQLLFIATLNMANQDSLDFRK